MAKDDIKPKSEHQAKNWSNHVENLYRFQLAGYRDEIEYKQVKQVDMVRSAGVITVTFCLLLNYYIKMEVPLVSSSHSFFSVWLEFLSYY